MLKRFFVIKTYYNVFSSYEKLKYPVYLTTQLFSTMKDVLDRRKVLVDDHISNPYFQRYMKENEITENEMRILLCHIEEIYRDDFTDVYKDILDKGRF